jgi:hypothetical protein
VFWQINFNDLVVVNEALQITLTQEISNTDSECHFNIFGLDNKSAIKYFKTSRNPKNYYFCCNNDHVLLSNENEENLLDYNCP